MLIPFLRNTASEATVSSVSSTKCSIPCARHASKSDSDHAGSRPIETVGSSAALPLTEEMDPSSNSCTYHFTGFCHRSDNEPPKVGEK